MRYSAFGFVGFYLLEDIHNRLEQIEHKLPSEEYLAERVEEYRSNFYPQFAEVIRDYLWLACAGEARHAPDKADDFIPEIRKRVTSRSSAYREARAFTPDSEWNRGVMQSVYYDTYWNVGSHGGTSWGDLARAVDLYYTVKDSPGAFIDHCADLQHNTGAAFNKPVSFWTHEGNGNLQSFLNLKFETDDLLGNITKVYDAESIASHIDKELVYILNKASQMFDSGVYFYSHKAGEWREHHIDYGDEKFSSIQSSRAYCDHCDHRYYIGDLNETAGGVLLCHHCSAICTECGDIVAELDAEKFQGELYCNECADVHKTACSICGMDFWNEGENVNDWLYCPTCMSNHCSECGEPKVKDYRTLEATVVEGQYGSTVNWETTEGVCQECVKKWLDAGEPVGITVSEVLVLGEESINALDATAGEKPEETVFNEEQGNKRKEMQVVDYLEYADLLDIGNRQKSMYYSEINNKLWAV